MPNPHIPALSVSTAHHVVFTVLVRFCIYIIKALDMYGLTNIVKAHAD
jgi:hypothetical protein